LAGDFRNVFPPAGGKVVDSANFIALSDDSTRQRGADEACDACDQVCRHEGLMIKEEWFFVRRSGSRRFAIVDGGADFAPQFVVSGAGVSGVRKNFRLRKFAPDGLQRVTQLVS